MVLLASGRAVLKMPDFFFLTKDSPRGPLTANRQPPPTGNWQPALGVSRLFFVLAEVAFFFFLA